MCTPCSGLRYKSKSESHPDRMLRKARKIRDRLGADWGAGMIVSKPKGMHWSTFFRLEEQLADLESVVLQYELGETIRHFGLRV